MTPPPWDLLVELTTNCVAPSLLVTGSVVGIGTRIFRGRYANILIGIALLAGMATAHGLHRDWAFPFLIFPERALEWLPWLTLLAMLIGLVSDSDRIPWMLRLLARLGCATLSACLLVPEDWRTELPWLVPVFIGATTVPWMLLDIITRNGPRSMGPMLISSILLAASWLLASTFATLAEWSMCLAACWLGIGIISLFSDVRCGGIVGSSAIPLVGVLMIGAYYDFGMVPEWCYKLVGLAPFAVVPGVLAEQRGLRTRWVAMLTVGGVTAMLLTTLVLTIKADAVPWD